MKQIFTVMAALAICVSMLAQPQRNLSERLQKTHDFIYSLPNRNQIDSAFLQKLIQLQFDGDNASELKSATALKPRLDKVETPGYSKTEFTYDENGWNIFMIKYSWSAINSTWVNVEKAENTFSETGTPTGGESYSWDGLGNKWRGTRKLKALYDDYGNLIDFAIYNWNETNEAWFCKTRNEKKYDAKKNQLMTADYYWNSYSQKLEGQRKYETEYDANSNKTLEIEYKWNVVTQDWVLSNKAVRTYNASSKQSSYVYYDWKSAAPAGWIAKNKSIREYDAVSGDILTDYKYTWKSGGWAESEREIYSYNALGLLDQKLVETKSGDVWESTFKYVYKYDANANKILYEECRYNNGWVTHRRNTLTFDAQNHELTSFEEAMENGSMVNKNKSNFAYDANGNRTLSERYIWSGSNWIGDFKEERQFDSNGKPILLVGSDWNSVSNDWFEFCKEYLEYDSDKVKSFYAYDLNVNDNVWVGRSGVEFVYDGVDNTIKTQEYKWHPTNKNWYCAFVKTTTYNDAYSKADLILPAWDDYYTQPVNGLIKTYDIDLNLSGDFITTYYYSDMQVTGTDEKMALPALTIWPNPASDVIALEGISGVATVYISSLNGSLVLTAEVQAGQSIPVSQLAKGVYLVKAVSDGGTFESKLVIK
jgi:hypothetical protein